MAAQFVVPLLLLVFCTWKGEHIVNLAPLLARVSTKPKRCCKPKCGSVCILWSVICFKGAAQVQCFSSTGCGNPENSTLGEKNTAQECCIIDEALSFESGSEPCVACLGVSGNFKSIRSGQIIS